MKLFQITNGYIGESYVRCLVIAATEAAALDLARQKFKSEASRIPNRYPWPEQYYSDLKAECLCGDVTMEWAGEVTDG